MNKDKTSHQDTAQSRAESFSDFRSLLLSSARRYGAHEAYRFRRHPKAEEETRSFEDIRQDVQNLAEYILMYFPASERAHFAFAGPNSYEWIFIHLAAMTAGTVSVPLDNLLPQTELLNLLERGDCQIFCASAAHAESGLKALHELPKLKLLILNDLTLGKKDKLPKDFDVPAGKKIVLLSDALEEGRKIREAGKGQYLSLEQKPGELAVVFYTSGTTAEAKGVMLSQINILANLASIAEILPIYPGERFLSVLPMHHTFEHTAGQLYPLSEGPVVCFADGQRYIGNNIREWAISWMIGWPRLFASLWRVFNKKIEHAGLSGMMKMARSLARGLEKVGIKAKRKIFAPVIDAMGGKIRAMVVGAASADLEVVRGFNDIGIEFFQGYGMTEHSPVIASCTSELNVPGSVGAPLPGVEVVIDEDPDLEAGQGEITVRSDSVMLGYYKDEARTKEALDENGRLHTGDMGYFDKRGALHITGRYKSMIVLPNGKKVFPEEVEALFGQMDGVEDVLVWGAPNERGGIDLSVRFALAPSAFPEDFKQTDRHIRSYLEKEVERVNKLLPDYKHIRYFVFSDEGMIKSTTRKIKRHEEIERLNLYLLTEHKTIRSLNGKRIL